MLRSYLSMAVDEPKRFGAYSASSFSLVPEAPREEEQAGQVSLNSADLLKKPTSYDYPDGIDFLKNHTTVDPNKQAVGVKLPISSQYVDFVPEGGSSVEGPTKFGGAVTVKPLPGVKVGGAAHTNTLGQTRQNLSVGYQQRLFTNGPDMSVGSNAAFVPGTPAQRTDSLALSQAVGKRVVLTGGIESREYVYTKVNLGVKANNVAGGSITLTVGQEEHPQGQVRSQNANLLYKVASFDPERIFERIKGWFTRLDRR
ncbi:MAG: hypothetical protein R3C68_03880 [Myxococcota bacterium]